MKRFLNIFLTNRFYLSLGILATLFFVSFFVPFIYPLVKALTYFFISILFIDFIILFAPFSNFQAKREMLEKLSNGDDNEVKVYFENKYSFKVFMDFIDEIPVQFQIRDLNFKSDLKAGEKRSFIYYLRPVKRGFYEFGKLRIFVSSPISLLKRRYSFENEQSIPVYPSYIQMKKYELLAISNTLLEGGIKKIRKIGHNLEFEQIRNYVLGDDYRSINWKATARKSSFMVNQYQDEKSQQVYNVIDKSRVMQMPFNGLSLLDYSINSALALSNIIIKKYDKAGLITFAEADFQFLKAERNSGQMMQINEKLFNQKTRYLEADYERLFINLKRNLSQRSLLIFYTNFETQDSLKRVIKYFKSIAKSHVVVIVFFENSELKSLSTNKAIDLESIYVQTIARKMELDKKLIVSELSKNGIYSVLTKPEDLTINTINKYLELKARGIF